MSDRYAKRRVPDKIAVSSDMVNRQLPPFFAIAGHSYAG